MARSHSLRKGTRPSARHRISRASGLAWRLGFRRLCGHTGSADDLLSRRPSGTEGSYASCMWVYGRSLSIWLQRWRRRCAFRREPMVLVSPPSSHISAPAGNPISHAVWKVAVRVPKADAGPDHEGQERFCHCLLLNRRDRRACISQRDQTTILFALMEPEDGDSSESSAFSWIARSRSTTSLTRTVGVPYGSASR
jgi:hypothetical protein